MTLDEAADIVHRSIRSAGTLSVCGLSLRDDLDSAVNAEREECGREINRLRAEVAALRKRAGDGSSAEPIGCPTPGACSCPK